MEREQEEVSIGTIFRYSHGNLNLRKTNFRIVLFCTMYKCEYKIVIIYRILYISYIVLQLWTM